MSEIKRFIIKHSKLSGAKKPTVGKLELNCNNKFTFIINEATLKQLNTAYQEAKDGALDKDGLPMIDRNGKDLSFSVYLDNRKPYETGELNVR